MWYPVTLPTPTAEPVTLDMAKAQVRVLGDDENDTLTRMTKAARAYCEGYTGQAFGLRSVTLSCDSFADLSRLPVAPVSAVTEIAYTDAAGAAATVGAGDYELRADGLESSVAWIGADAWPTIKAGTRITVTATVGVNVPDDVLHAMLVHVGDSFEVRENAKAEDWSAVDLLLANHRFYS